jgi:tight adherence protein C
MPPIAWLTVVSVFGSVALAVGAIAWSTLERATPERRRLERASLLGSPSGVLLENPTLTSEPTPFIKQLTSIVPRSPKDVTRLRKKFIRAGYQTLTPVAVYSVCQISLPIVFGLSALVFVPLKPVWPIVALSAAVGYLLPGFWLSRSIKARQKVITNGLPDALDLMIVCLEAGSAMDQAMMKVGEELATAYPALSEEFKLLITETRAGKPRIEAFRNLADRTGVEDVRSLVSMLVQTDRFGTSVSQALRTHAEVSRTKRRQRAEETAAKIGVKLVFPLVFLLFPAFFVVTLGPAIIQFMHVLMGQVMGQQ